MRVVRVLAVASVLLLQGCWFVFIPGSFIDSAADGLSGAEGHHCVSSTAKVGDRVQMPNGSMWTVASLSGTSYRCRESHIPIRARLDPA